eukprot:Skav204136  [mRNA]  locus=scaffold4340:27363:32756:+ [translate_table: standard]
MAADKTDVDVVGQKRVPPDSSRMLRGRGLMIYVTILSLLATLASAGVKGFGIIFSVEPMKGSTGGGTEIHVAGAGFAYVTHVLVGGKPCHILEQMTKDGELTAFTPALPQGKYEVEVVFTSGVEKQRMGRA